MDPEVYTIYAAQPAAGDRTLNIPTLWYCKTLKYYEHFWVRLQAYSPNYSAEDASASEHTLDVHLQKFHHWLIDHK